MIFPTVEFAIFFLIVFLGSWALIPHEKARKVFLTAASYFFYGFWDWRFLPLLLVSTLANFAFGRLIGLTQHPKARSWALALAVTFNLGLLAFFKYFNFFTITGNNMLMGLGMEPFLPTMNIILPIGISFFTFQALSYVIDVYRREIPATKSLLDLMVYKAFFPQLVAGPIVRASDFLPQLQTAPDPKRIDFSKAAILILSGLFKKVIIANYLAVNLVDKVFQNPSAFSGPEVWLAVYGYAVQIFCDFSAYTDIAIGVALLLGYRFPVNFDNPYRAQSIQEFWRRWHISLSSWLRDYLYIPLGGNRKGKIRTYINLIITMLLGGLWHGASWNFVIWGALHGVGQAIEKFVYGTFKIKEAVKPRWVQVLMVVFTFHFVCFGWIFFRAGGSFDIAMDMLAGLFAPWTASPLITPLILLLVVFGIWMHFWPSRWAEKLQSGFDRLPLVLKGAAAGLVLILISAMAPEGIAPFIYFQF